MVLFYWIMLLYGACFPHKVKLISGRDYKVFRELNVNIGTPPLASRNVVVQDLFSVVFF